MRFEHLMQVNDPRDPRVRPMSRAELWRGLLRRVESPQDFPLGPDRCSTRAEDAGGELFRSVYFGNLGFEDCVRLEPEQRLTFTPQPHEGAAPVALTITLEEPAPGALCLRFIYQIDGETTADEKALQPYREQAWLEMDRDMLRTLREWQHAGTL